MRQRRGRRRRRKRKGRRRGSRMRRRKRKRRRRRRRDWNRGGANWISDAHQFTWTAFDSPSHLIGVFMNCSDLLMNFFYHYFLCEQPIF